MTVVSKHQVFVTPPLMGHLRPMINFAMNLLRLHPNLQITFIHQSSFSKIVEAEAGRHGDNLDRLHPVPLGEDKGTNMDTTTELFPAIMEMVAAFEGAYTELLKSDIPPTLMLLDSVLQMLPPIKAQAEAAIGTKSRIPFHIFCVVPPVYWLRMADILSDNPGCRYSDDPCRPGYLAIRDTERMAGNQAILFEEIHNLTGQAIESPGVPPMYPYEYFPQPAISQLPPVVLSIWKGGLDLAMSNPDGEVTVFDPTMDYEGMEALNNLPGKASKGMLVGPQFLPGYWQGSASNTKVKEVSIGSSVEGATAFLDRMFDKFGKKSVLFISFGTIAFPKEPDHYTALLKTLISMSPPLPVLFIRDPKFMKLSEDIEKMLQKRIEEGLMEVVQFCPQQEVLLHPATGWFLSHGGSGSTHEAIVAKVPMVMWPVAYDQPQIAAVLSQRLKVAFELHQVRCGINIGRPVAATGVIVEGTIAAIEKEMAEVFGKMRGQEGSEVRKRIEELGEKFKKSWESGDAKRGMIEFGGL